MVNAERAPLRVELREGVLWLTKTNPEEGYGISLAMLEALSAAIAAAATEPTLRVVVIDAEGRGHHEMAVMVTELKPRLEDLTREDFRRVVEMGQSLGRDIAALPVPVIGIARGGARGGGLELLLRCDLLYCTDPAHFSFPEVTLGFIAAWGGTQWAGRQMTYRKAQEFLLLGQTIGGREAEAYGLVTRSFADGGALCAHVDDVLARLRICSPASLRWTKACLAACWQGTLTHGESVEMMAEIETLASGEFLEAVAASANRQQFDFFTRSRVPRR